MLEKFEDLRAKVYLANFDEGEKILEVPPEDIIASLKYNQNTKWTDNSLPKKVLDYGKIPPFDLKELHTKGITGKGVNVAIIDQPLALNHPEYKEQIVSYKEFAPKGMEMPISSMHGPAVASLLVGKDIGAAPKAKVHYYSFPSWLRDSLYAAQALEDIIKTNKKLSDEDKIKFVSVSACLSGQGSPFKYNLDAWDKAFDHAKKEGICVVDCSEKGFIAPGYIDYVDKQFYFGFPKNPKTKSYGLVHVPNSLRTIAESYDNQHFTYCYSGLSGLSWGIPYAVGILALGQQLAPNLSAEELKNILIYTAQKNECIINPKRFIDKVEEIIKHQSRCKE